MAASFPSHTVLKFETAEFCQLDSAKREMIHRISKESEMFAEILATLQIDQDKISDLVLEQVLVSQKFNDYHQIWRNTSVVIDPLIYEELNHEVEQFHHLQSNSERTARKVVAVIGILIGHVKELLIQLQDAIEKVMKSETEEDLKCLNMPNHLSFVESLHLYPDVDALFNEWRQLEISQRMNEIFLYLDNL